MTTVSQNKQFFDTALVQRAFPHVNDHQKNETTELGLTARQYAAIKLRVPDSGDEWLDAMIRESLRDEFAGKVLPAYIAMPANNPSILAYAVADKMIAERSK